MSTKRITKEIAENVAIKMTEKKLEAINKAKANLCEFVYSCVLPTIPKPVMESFLLHPNWFKKTTSVDLRGNGFNHKRVYSSKHIPSVNDWSIVFEPDTKQAKELLKLIDKYESLKKERELLQRDLENALYNLKTYNAVKENLPECYDFLPEKQTTALALNLADLKTRLKNQ